MLIKMFHRMLDYLLLKLINDSWRENKGNLFREGTLEM